MKRADGVVFFVSLAACCASAAAADMPSAPVDQRAGQPASQLAGQLAGKTLSAVAYMPRSAGMPGGGELARLMLQAYLRADGRALVRAWDTTRNAYTVPVERDWSLNGSNFCVGLPAAPGTLCADIHVWGPRIAGINARPYAMLDGDLQPGNAVAAR
jgi:hypothetical protein